MTKPSGGSAGDAGRFSMSKRTKSPCVDVCAYIGPKGWCAACGMTRDESRGWRSMRPFDRKNVMKQLQKRRHQMKGMNLHADD